MLKASAPSEARNAPENLVHRVSEALQEPSKERLARKIDTVLQKEKVIEQLANDKWNGDVAGLKESLKSVRKMAVAKQELEQKVEKKGIIRRLLGYVGKHPIKTALVVAALAVGGYVGWHYLGANIMSWMHGLSTSAPAQVLRDAFNAPGMIPPAPSAPTAPLDYWNVPLGKG